MAFEIGKKSKRNCAIGTQQPAQGKGRDGQAGKARMNPQIVTRKTSRLAKNPGALKDAITKLKPTLIESSGNPMEVASMMPQHRLGSLAHKNSVIAVNLTSHLKAEKTSRVN